MTTKTPTIDELLTELQNSLQTTLDNLARDRDYFEQQWEQSHQQYENLIRVNRGLQDELDKANVTANNYNQCQQQCTSIQQQYSELENSLREKENDIVSLTTDKDDYYAKWKKSQTEFSIQVGSLGGLSDKVTELQNKLVQSERNATSQYSDLEKQFEELQEKYSILENKSIEEKKPPSTLDHAEEIPKDHQSNPIVNSPSIPTYSRGKLAFITSIATGLTLMGVLYIGSQFSASDLMNITTHSGTITKTNPYSLDTPDSSSPINPPSPSNSSNQSGNSLDAKIDQADKILSSPLVDLLVREAPRFIEYAKKESAKKYLLLMTMPAPSLILQSLLPTIGSIFEKDSSLYDTRLPPKMAAQPPVPPKNKPTQPKRKVQQEKAHSPIACGSIHVKDSFHWPNGWSSYSCLDPKHFSEPHPCISGNKYAPHTEYFTDSEITYHPCPGILKCCPPVPPQEQDNRPRETKVNDTHIQPTNTVGVPNVPHSPALENNNNGTGSTVSPAAVPKSSPESGLEGGSGRGSEGGEK